MSNTFCVLPWLHLQTKPNGQIKPCCRFDTKHADYKIDKGFKFDKFNINDVDTTFANVLNSAEWAEIREKMLNNEKVSGCRKCYQEEEFAFNNNYKNAKRKVKSLRYKETRMHNNKNLEYPEDTSIKLKYLEITMGNYCNLKCRTCDSSLSTTWNEDDSILSKYYNGRKVTNITNIEKDWDLNDFAYIEEIKFTGGEPMLHPNFVKILDLVISTGRQHLITLNIFTNASWVPKEKVISRLNQFNKVTINLSVDGLGHINEYIRFPSVWTDVNESVNTWLQLEKDSDLKYLIKWMPVISVYNVLDFHNMIDWWLDLQKAYKNKYLWESDRVLQSYVINVVHDPNFLRPSLIPNKKELIEQLLAHKKNLIKTMTDSIKTDEVKIHNNELEINTIYNKVISAINEEFSVEQIKDFIEYTVDLDSLRGQDIKNDLPLLWEQFKNIEYKGRING